MSGHIEKHQHLPLNCYADPVEVRKTVRLVKDPLAHAKTPDDVLWTRHEVQLFLESYLQFPKDFVAISKRLAHKSVGQLVQFYFEFKWSLKLKEYSHPLIIGIARS